MYTHSPSYVEAILVSRFPRYLLINRVTFFIILMSTCFISKGQVVINEVITDPQQDWSSGGFLDAAPGGSAGSDDEWIELYINANGLDLTNWTITVDDGSPFSGDLTNTGAFDVVNYVGSGTIDNTQIGDYVILGNPDGGGAINNDGLTITLEDDNSPTPNVIDQIVIDGASGTMFSGNASSVDDESVTRIPDGTDTGVEADDFVLTRATLGTSNSPAGVVLINEVVTDPQQDWSENDFDGTIGGVTVTQGTDEWIELYIGTSGLNLTKWTIDVDDNSGDEFNGDLTSSGAFQVVNYVGSGSFLNTQVGDYVVLGNPTGSAAMNNDVYIRLYHPDGSMIDDVEIGDDAESDGAGDGAADGSASGGDASGVADEVIARIANGTDSDNDVSDFRQMSATMGAENGISTVYVDASATDDDGAGTVGDPKQLIQSGIDMALAGGTVNVVAGTYSESLTISKALTLNGANQGTAGNGSRSSESIIDPSSNLVGLTISSDNVTVDGFQFGTSSVSSNITNGIVTSNTGSTIQNNIIYANSIGVLASGASTGTVSINNNLIDMLAVEDALNATSGSIGLALSSFSGDVDLNVNDNDISNAGIGVFTYGLSSSTEAVIDGGTYTGCTTGMLPSNYDGAVSFSPSTLTLQNITMSGFVTDPDVTSPDTESGVYVFTGGGTASDDITITMNNLDISGVGNGASNHSAIIIGDFPATSDDAGINATITNCNIHDNSNRGIYTRGADAVTNISQSTISGNGFNPFDSSNPGFSVVARDNSVTTVSNCFISNAASQTSENTEGLSMSAGGTLTVSDCNLDQNGNGTIAGQTGMDLSGNYFGTTTEATILSLVGSGNDFTPWLNSGTDTDGGTAGFQGDFSGLIVGTSGAQTSSGRIEEGISLVSSGGTVTVNAGTYAENLTISKSVTLNGANQGVSGSGSRGTETIIEPSSSNVGMTIGASDITIDGFQFGTNNTTSNNSTAISNTGFSGLTASNNVIYSNSAGVVVIGVSSGSIIVSNNNIEMLNLEDPLTATNPSIGIYTISISGTADVDITNNDISTASYGVFGFALTSSTDLVIDGGTITGSTKGIEVDNADGAGNYSPSTITIQNVTMSGFTGPDADVFAPDAQAGIYLGAFSTLGSGSATDADDLNATITGVDISGVGNTQNDYSAIYVADFSSGEPTTGTSDLIAIDASVTNSTIQNNLNRGIYTRGANATTTVTTSTFTGNGSNPFSTGASLATFAAGTINVTNSFFTNPASGSVDALFSIQNGTISATDNSLDQNGNGDLAETQTGGTIDLSRNWLGTTDLTTITGLVTVSDVDFSPWLSSGTDTDGGAAGFQPDLSGLLIGPGGSQTSGILQEGHDNADADGSLTIASATYSETLTITKNLSITPESGTTIDNVTLNGGRLTVLDNLTINNTLTLTDGILDIDPDIGSKSDDPVLTLSNAVSGTGGSTNHIEGKVEVAIGAAGSYTFPMGDYGTYRPVILSPTNATTFSVAHVWLESPTGAGTNGSMADLIGDASSQLSGNIESVLSGMFWELDVVSGTPGTTTVTIQINGSDNASDASTLGIARFDGTDWTEITRTGGSGSDPYTVSGTTSSFSDFSIYSTDATANPLPVELDYFNGRYENESIRLTWSTLSEQNSDYFQIERSFDQSEFESIAMVAAAGNSTSRIDYEFSDRVEDSNAHYYRMKMVDVDGTYEYSPTIVVLPNAADLQLTMYPNPTTDLINISGINPTHVKVIRCIDLNGRVQRMNISSQQTLDLSPLRSTTYILQIELLDGRVYQGRIVKD